MPRAIKDAKLDTRTARAKLKVRREPYWRAVDRGAHLGYRKGARGGYWIARKRGDAGKYLFLALGMADDARDADGSKVLDFFRAQALARDWFAEESRGPTGSLEAGEPTKGGRQFTVRDAMEEYMTWYSAHGKGAATHQYSVDAFILPELGNIKLVELTAHRIRNWHQGLAEKPPRVRKGKKDTEQRYRDTSNDPDAARKRKSSANRVLTVLKAALNHAWHEGNVTSDDAWRRVKAFKSVDVPRVRYLSQAECVRLVNSCDPDLRLLVQAALCTGCRYGELAGLQVSDFHPDSGTVLVRESKRGSARHVILTEDGQRLFRGITVGRSDNETMLKGANGRAWQKDQQRRPLLSACQRAGIDPPIQFHGLRHTYASQLVMAGIPLEVVAKNLGHADTRMCEKHYAHLSQSYIADLIRAAAPTLGVIDSGNVVGFGAR